MYITATCKCGKQIQAEDTLIGQAVMCPVCWRDIPLPHPDEASPPAMAKNPVPPPADAAEPPSAPPPANSIREYAYWFLPVFFLPLAFALGQEKDNLKERIRQSIDEAPPALRDQIERVGRDKHSTLDDLLRLLPGHRLVGAWLPRSSGLHWVFALGSLAAFLAVIGPCFGDPAAQPRHLMLVGLFTGTLGIGFLFLALLIPPVAVFMHFCQIREMANPGDFLTILAANTLAVGLFEETIKMIPLIWYLRRFDSIRWRQACLWGLASGVGFGISEGIEYSRVFYHGVTPGLMYLERFASCVALHAVLSAAAGITLFKAQSLFHELQRDLVQSGGYSAGEDLERFGKQWLVYGIVALRAVAVVMVLHGLFNTSLTVDLPFVSVLAAIGSFGWLAWQVESCRRAEQLPGAA